MKRIVSLVFAASALAAAAAVKAFETPMKTQTPKTDKNGHVLVREWKEYDAAVSADRPKTAMEILSGIKQRAAAGNYALDFRDAAEAYVSAGTRINWKMRDSLWKSLASEVEAFDNPLVSFSHASGYVGDKAAKEIVERDRDRLLQGADKVFWKHGDLTLYIDNLPDYISSDYEYTLWCLLGNDFNLAYEDLSSLLGGSYPGGALLEYLLAVRKPAFTSDSSPSPKTLALREFASKYASRGISFLARADLLRIRMDSLERSKAGQEEYLSLLEECRKFDSDKKKLSRSEAAVAGGCNVQTLKETLQGKWISASVDGNTVTLRLRNLESATLSVARKEDGGTMRSFKVINPVRSFYVIDTVRMELPAMDDGDYELLAESGKHSSSVSFSRFTLSVATRKSSSGHGVYLTDYSSGEPLGAADFVLKKNGIVVAEEPDFPLGDGFTSLPAAITGIMDEKSGYTLECFVRSEDDIVRKARPLSITSRTWAVRGPSVTDMANLYLDRRAFNPGDEAFFKGVLFRRDLIDTLSAFGEGEKVVVALYDSEGNKLEEKALATNGFGSVAGSFTLPGQVRGGVFRIELSHGSSVLAMEDLRVDEFVLPTFTLEFDKISDLYLSGDIVPVTGKITSYSGHSLSSADISYKAVRGGTVLGEGRIEADGDGRFRIAVPTDAGYTWQDIRVTVRVSDLTGETLEFGTSFYVTDIIIPGIALENKTDAIFEFSNAELSRYSGALYLGSACVSGAEAVFGLSMKNSQGTQVPADISYRLLSEQGELLEEGSCASGEKVIFDLDKHPSGLYSLMISSCKVSAVTGKSISVEGEFRFFRLDDGAAGIDSPVDSYVSFTPETVAAGGRFGVRTGSADRPLWVVAELYGKDRRLLESRVIYLDGVRGGIGSLSDLEFEYLPEYPDAVLLNLFWFRDSRSHDFSRTFRRERRTLDLPLRFSCFEDRTLPGKPYSFTLQTLPDVELLAAVYDKSLDNIRPNRWAAVLPGQFNVDYVDISSAAGSLVSYGNALIGHPAGRSGRVLRMAKSASFSADEEVLPFQLNSDSVEMVEEAALAADDDVTSAMEVEIRDEFPKTLAFEPFLRSDAAGEAVLDFTTGGKLSTYVVSVYAHDRGMRNALIRRDMVVSLPVKVDVAEPQFLYCGDCFKLSVALSSVSDEPVKGTLSVLQYDTENYKDARPVVSSSRKVTIAPGASLSGDFDVKAPSRPGTVGLKVVFDAGEYSDGVFVSVPVYVDSQVLTETHSAVLLPGMDRDSLISQMRKRFTGVSSAGAAYREISVLDMVRDAIPGAVEPVSDNVLAISEAWYMRLLSAKLLGTAPSSEDLLARIMACRNADGGFGWFEGMQSSPAITAVLLERFAKLARAGLYASSGLEPSVRYLDDSQFSSSRPRWCGGLSDEQYMYVRSLYPEVPFDVRRMGVAKVFDTRMAEFRKFAKEYLVPGKDRGLDSYILAKARRLRTLDNLCTSVEGLALAKSWGLSWTAGGKLRSSLAADAVSLLEYAVDHREGGIYYPNAVMPFRGLLESEAYAHSLICDLLSSPGVLSEVAPADSVRALEVADGIRIWLMLQKETQQWDSEPGYVDAVNSVLSGPESVLGVRVLVLSKSYEVPFKDVRAAGNGFTVTRTFVRERTVDGRVETVEIQPGAVLRTGDKITAVYKVHNDENRSFVRLTAPREAAFRPADQLSGYRWGWTFRPLSSGTYSFAPMGYREVKAEKSVWYFDSFPEEESTVKEDFFVVRDGIFTAPVVEIESLYAPHYRANAAFGGKMVVADGR